MTGLSRVSFPYVGTVQCEMARINRGVNREEFYRTLVEYFYVRALFIYLRGSSSEDH